MPKAMVRLSAGRQEMSEAVQALCFFAGANSIFYGEKLLTTGNPDVEARPRALREARAPSAWSVESVESSEGVSQAIETAAPLLRDSAECAFTVADSTLSTRMTSPRAAAELDGLEAPGCGASAACWSRRRARASRSMAAITSPSAATTTSVWPPIPS